MAGKPSEILNNLEKLFKKAPFEASDASKSDCLRREIVASTALPPRSATATHHAMWNTGITYQKATAEPIAFYFASSGVWSMGICSRTIGQLTRKKALGAGLIVSVLGTLSTSKKKMAESGNEFAEANFKPYLDGKPMIFHQGSTGFSHYFSSQLYGQQAESFILIRRASSSARTGGLLHINNGEVLTPHKGDH
ncbi:hypothetical protein AJ78_03228 [Emergomyces pasteurianus Ep9510]|uniref:Uncharacterized protein n=1 Tax=Emergomyces pasteurianus Ep9510 TaxID=1447872 RepID=A0A1J9QL83_9EURO|nr:hypothetical protein AJ78_03228 [Emergomyces pasteurianus Ep9510]